MSKGKAIVILFTSNGMGKTDAQDLREQLAIKFLRLLSESGTLPRVICFYTDGVKLACDRSPVLNELRALEAQGVELVVCSTCLEYFGLREQVRVGVVGGMPDILTAMQEADSVISV
jgi:sulfur relay (sulfurtransferase) complex TusBCD TusD component (DsrE family)